MRAAAAALVVLAIAAPEREPLPRHVRERIEEVCNRTVREAIEAETNAFTRRFVTETVIRRGIVRCTRSHQWWLRRLYRETKDWGRALEGYE